MTTGSIPSSSDGGSALSTIQESTTSSETTRKHPTYWFEDGSLVVHVEDTLFKVHHTLISRHSPFFSSNSCTSPKDMAELDQEIGLPFSYVSVSRSRGAKAKDAERLLEHLYHDVSLTTNTSFDRVASILRITSPQQLNFPKLHGTAKDLLKAMFPGGPAPFTHPEELHEALSLATEFQVPSTRKALLYSLVTTTQFHEEASSDFTPSENNGDPPTHTLSGSDTSASDVCSSVEGTDTVIIGREARLTDRRTLSSSDAKLCGQLMSQLIEHFTPILFTPATTSHMACTDVFADTWMLLVIQPALEDDGVYKPLETLERIKDIDWGKHGLCPSCVIEKREEWTNEQNVVWKLMDGWLGIDSATAP